MEDISVIDKLMSLRKQQNKDWWNLISEDERSSIEKGLEDANKGNLQAHSKAHDIYGKWL